jgi:hypothetical protein
MQVSLETSDYAEAVRKAQELIDSPLLNTTTGFKADLDAFADFQTSSNNWTKKSRKSKCSVLMMFGEDLGFPALSKITTGEIQNWYDKQIKRIKVVSVNPAGCLGLPGVRRDVPRIGREDLIADHCEFLRSYNRHLIGFRFT